MSSVTHRTRFETRRDGLWHRAICTCGWSGVETDLAALQARAAVHDMEWQPAEPTEPGPFWTAPQS